MPTLLLNECLNQCGEIRLMIGQTFDNETFYLYDILVLNSKYTQYFKDLSIKANLSSFIDQIQEITTMISFGIKPLGFILSEKSIQMTNLNILKKISQALNVQNFLYGTYQELELFDLKTLKSSKVKIQIDSNLQVRSFYHTRSLTFSYSPEDHKAALNKYTETIRRQINRKKLILNQQILHNEKESIFLFSQDQNTQVQILEPQSVEVNQQQEISSTRLQGDIHLKVYGNQYITGSMIKDLLVNDLEDQLNLRLNLDQTDQYVLQRIEITFNHNKVSFQDFKDYNEPAVNVEAKILRNFKECQLLKIETFDELSQLIIPEYDGSKNIELISPLIKQEKKYVKKQANRNIISEYWLLGLFIMLLSIGFGLKMM